MKLIVDLKGVHSTTVTLADGTKKTYYYAWKGKGAPRLEGEPGSEEFAASYDAAKRALSEVARRDDLSDLIDRFELSSFYRSKKPRTQRDFDRDFKIIRAKWGNVPKSVYTDKRFRQDMKAWRDSMLDTPRKAQSLWDTMRRVFNFAIDNSEMEHNPCARGGKIYSGTRVELVWTEQEIKAAEALPIHLWRPFIFALYTGQRQGDVLSLEWSQIIGQRVRITQSKTGKRVVFKLFSTIQEMLVGINDRGDKVFLNSRGKPWTSAGFQASFRKALRKNKISRVAFTDLRGTFITHCVNELGATVDDLIAISGHSRREALDILEKHYIAPDQSRGDKVIDLMEKRK